MDFKVVSSLVYLLSSFFCKVDPNNANGAIINFGVVPKSDSIYRIYAYDASQQDTLSTSNRIDGCFIDNTATNPEQDRIEKEITVDFDIALQPCGISMTGTTVKTMTVVFRTQAYANLFTGDDVVYRFQCFSDQLSEDEVATPGYSGSESVKVDLLEPNKGVTMRVRQENTNIPLSVVPLGQRVYMSIEFVPGKDEGPDNHGTQFFIGLLGNDVISAESAESLFLMVIPRYSVSTYVTVTSAYGSVSNMSDNQVVLEFNLRVELMGCSDDGVAEKGDKGVEITSTHEVSVLVCNREADTEDCYTALPVDVLDTDYVTVSKPATNEVSELMIIATEDATNVDLTLPSYTGLTVTLDTVSKGSGETLSFTLNKREAFHLAVTSPSAAESVVGFKIHADKLVSVISGNRKYSNDHLEEQIPGTTKLGQKYVLTPTDPFEDSQTATYIIQATADGDTVVQRYLTSSTSDTYTISQSTSPPLTIDVSPGSPCELTSDKPILVAQVVGERTSSKGLESAMLIMPTVEQWAPKYSIYVKDSTTVRLIFVFPSEAAANDLKLESNGNTFSSSITQVVDVDGPNGYKFYSAMPLSTNTLFTVSSTDAVTLFLVLVYAANADKSSGIAFLPFGTRYPSLDQCEATLGGKQGDLLDNDCDGLIDEELVNLLDDDLDGKVDEDPVNAAEAYSNVVAIRPHTCKASGLSDFSDSSKIIDMTLSTGCATTETGPFTPKAEFSVTSAAGGRKIYNSGVFEMAMFENENNVYLKCELDVCFKEDDTNCIPICQQATTQRRKRENTNDTSVGTVVQVIPKIVGPDTTSNESSSYMDPIKCLENSYFLTIFIVLIILVIISFSAAICFCCLFRQRRNESKTRTHYGFHRKSF